MATCPNLPSKFIHDVQGPNFSSTISPNGKLDPEWENFFEDCYNRKVKDNEIRQAANNELNANGLSKNKYSSEIYTIIKVYQNYVTTERANRKLAFEAHKEQFFEEHASKETLNSKNKPKVDQWNAIKKKLEGDWFLSQDIKNYKTEYEDLLNHYNYKIKEKYLFTTLRKNNKTAKTDVYAFIDNNFKGTEGFQKEGIYKRYLGYQNSIRTNFSQSLQQNPLPSEIQKLFEDLSELKDKQKLKNGDIGKKLQQDYFVVSPFDKKIFESEFNSYYNNGSRIAPTSEEKVFENIPYGIKDEKTFANEINAKQQSPLTFQDEYLKRFYNRYKEKTKEWKEKRDKFNYKLNKENEKFEGWIRGNFDRARVSSLLESKYGFKYQKERDKLLTKGFDAYLASRTTFDEDKLINDLLNDYSGHLLKGQKFIIAATSRGMPQNTPQAQENAFYNKYRRAQKNYVVGTKTGTTPFLIEQQRRVAAKNLDIINPKALTRADHRNNAKPIYMPWLLPQTNQDAWGYSSIDPNDFSDAMLSQPVMGESVAVELESEQNRRTTQGALETLYSYRRHATDEYAKGILKRYGVNAKDPWFKDVKKAMKINSTNEEKKYFTALYRLQDFLGKDDDTLMRQRAEREAQGKAPTTYDDPASFFDKINPLSSYNKQGREYEGKKKEIHKKITVATQEYLDKRNQGYSEKQLASLNDTIDRLSRELSDLEESRKKHNEGYRRSDTLKDKVSRERSNADALLRELKSIIDPVTNQIKKGAKPSQALAEFLKVHNDEQAGNLLSKDLDYKAENKWAEIRNKRRKERQEKIERTSEEWGEKGRNVGELVGSYLQANTMVYSGTLNAAGFGLRKMGFRKTGKSVQAAGKFVSNASSKAASSVVVAGYSLGKLFGKLAGWVGIAITAFSGLISAIKKGYEAIEKQVAKMLSYAKFDSGLAIANLKSKGRQYYRDISYAKGVSKTGVKLIAERERMQDNLTPFRTAIDNAKNVFLTYLAKGFNKFLEALKPLLPFIRLLGRATEKFASVSLKVGQIAVKVLSSLLPVGFALKQIYKLLVKVGEKFGVVDANKEDEAKDYLNNGRIKSKEKLKDLRGTEEYKKLYKERENEARERIANARIKNGVPAQYAYQISKDDIEEEIFNDGKTKVAGNLAAYSKKIFDTLYQKGKVSDEDMSAIEHNLTKYMNEGEKKSFNKRSEENTRKYRREYAVSLKAFSDYYDAIINPNALNMSDISKQYKAKGFDVNSIGDLREIIMNSTIIAESLKEQIKLIEEGNKERQKITKNTAPKDGKTGDIILDALSSIGSRYSAPSDTANLKKAEEVERSKQYGRFAEATVAKWGRRR